MKNYKIILIAAVLIIAAFVAVPVSAHVPYYESKIVPINITEDVHGMPSWATGTIKIQLRCHISTLTTGYNLYTDKDNYTSFIYIPFDKNGYSEEQIVAGKYRIDLVPFGNGEVPESSYITVVNGYDAYPDRQLLGQAVSGVADVEVPSSAPVSSCKDLDVVTAVYGGDFSKSLAWNLVNMFTHHKQYVVVTSTVDQFVSNDMLKISSDYNNQHYNALFTDPNYGIVKGLYVLYTCKETQNRGEHSFTIEVPHSEWVSETQDLNIPTI